MNQIAGAPAQTEPPILQLNLLNGFEVQIGAVKLNIAKEKVASLLALLAMNAPNRSSRVTLRGLLWADSDEAAAQNSLRNAIWVLRQLLADHGYRGLQSTRNEVWLDPALMTTDLAAIEKNLSNGTVSSLLFPDRGFPAEILSGVKATDLLDLRINEFRQAAQRRIFDLAKSALSPCPPDRRLTLLSLIAALDPANESHCRNLIEALVEAGRKSEALAAYQRLWNLLDQEYGEEPSKETQALIVALKTENDGRQKELDGKPTIILNVPSETGQAESRPAIDQHVHLHNLTLSTLTRFREWRIIDARVASDLSRVKDHSSGSIFALTIHLMTGEMSRATAILTEVSTGQVLWSESIALPGVPNLPDLDAAVRRLATAMHLHLTGPARQVTSAQTNTGHLYERWVEAQNLMRIFTPQSWGQAETLLDGILAESPQFVRALASRASLETMRHFTFPGLNSTADLHRKALRWANAATLADPMDSRAQIALAWACAMSRQFERAEIAFELAFQHNENDPWTITSALVGFAFCNRTARADALTKYLLDLQLPLTPIHWSYVAAARFLAGDDAGCVEMSERAQDCSCDVPAWHAAALAHLGRKTEARVVADRFRGLVRQAWVYPTSPKETEISAWLLGCFPIRSRAQWNRLRRGLILAGLQVPGQ